MEEFLCKFDLRPNVELLFSGFAVTIADPSRTSNLFIRCLFLKSISLTELRKPRFEVMYEIGFIEAINSLSSSVFSKTLHEYSMCVSE